MQIVIDALAFVGLGLVLIVGSLGIARPARPKSGAELRWNAERRRVEWKARGSRWT